MPPAEFFQFTEPLQVVLSRVPDDIVALYETVQADSTRSGGAWIALHTIIVEQTHACCQCDDGFSTDQILMSKTMNPCTMRPGIFLLVGDELRRRYMHFQAQQL